jgi:hypothetical protein
MQEQELPLWAAAALSGGLVAWLHVSRVSAGHPEALESLEDSPINPWKIFFGLPVSFGLATVAGWQTAEGVFRPLGVASWLSAVAVWFWAWRPPRPARPTATGGATRRKLDMRIAAALLLILAIGSVFRFYRLSEIPPHPGSDHAEDLMNVVDIEQGERPVFFPRNTGQPPLPFYWEFFLHRAFGLPLRYLTLKISTASIGMLAIPAIYFLGAELGGPALGLAAAALAAWSKWLTFGARRGLTYPFAVLPAAIALGMMLRYLRRGDRKSALLAGLWLGIGLYGYNAFKVVPLIVPAAVLLALFDPRWRERRGRLIADGLLIAATALLLFLPLFQFMLGSPEEFFFRALTRATSLERPLPGPPAAVFLSNLKNMLLAFHWRGDHSWIDTVTGEPFLDPVGGALLLAGAMVALVRSIRGSRRWALVLISIPILTLASTLSLAFPIENPGTNRAAVAAPSIFVLAALPAAWLVTESRKREFRMRLAVGFSLGAMAAVSLQQNFESYFVRYEKQQARLLPPVMDVVRVMKDYRARGVPFENVYLLDTMYWIDGRCIGFEIGDLSWSDIHRVAPDEPVPPILDRPLLFIVHPNDEERRLQLKERFPQGEERLVPQRFRDRDYDVYYVPR